MCPPPLCFTLFSIVYLLTYLLTYLSIYISVYLFTWVAPVPRCESGGHEITPDSPLSPSTMWVLGIKLGSRDLETDVISLRAISGKLHLIF